MFFIPTQNLLMNLSSSTRVAFVLMFATTLFSKPFHWCSQSIRTQNSFVLPWLASRKQIQWIKELEIGHAVELLPLLPHAQMAQPSAAHRSSYHPACMMAHPTLCWRASPVDASPSRVIWNPFVSGSRPMKMACYSIQIVLNPLQMQWSLLLRTKICEKKPRN